MLLLAAGQDACLLEQADDGVGRLRALREPLLRLVGVDVDLDRLEVEKGEAGVPPKGYAPQAGEPIFRLLIPKLDLNDGKGYIVVEGVDEESLKAGPGHFPKCGPGFAPPLCTRYPAAWPGTPGRVIVSGHRTTYKAPFLDTDKLDKGDEIIVETQSRGTYRVPASEAEQIVKAVRRNDRPAWHLLGKDEVEYRLSMLDSPRHVAVLEKAASEANWGQKLPAGVAQGVGMHDEYKSIAAYVMTVDTRGTADNADDLVTWRFDAARP